MLSHPDALHDLLGTAEAEAAAAAVAAGVAPLPGELPGRRLTLEDLASPAVIAEVAVTLLQFHDGLPLRATFSPMLGVAAHGDLAAVARRAAQALDPAHPDHAPVPCHNALAPARLLHDGERVWIVGWESGGMGNRVFDLAALAAAGALSAAGEEWLLESYWGEAPTRRRLAALRLMRVVADLHAGRAGAARAALSDPRFAVWLEDARGR